MVKELLQLQSTGSQGQPPFFKNRYKLDRKLGQRVLLQFKQSLKKTAIKLRLFFKKNIQQYMFHVSQKSSNQKIQPTKSLPWFFSPQQFPISILQPEKLTEVLGQGWSER